MYRSLIDQLVAWKRQDSRKPLLLDGARQVGKSYLLKENFAKPNFETTHLIDFLENKKIHEVFEGDLKPQTIIEKLELGLQTRINPKQDLIILDEIGVCPNAVNSLKFIAEQHPDWFVVASGSNVGLLDSFPVGKVHSLTLRPMNFEEFVIAVASEPEVAAFQRFDRSKVAHTQLWSLLVDYLFVGGMPEVVNYWATSKDEPLVIRRQMVQEIQRDVLVGFERDFGKYAGRNKALEINTVFRNIPKQLQNYLDGNAKRYKFAGVIPKKRGYKDFASIISWLEKTYLASRSYVVDRPEVPLKAFRKESFFKLYFLDVGLLSYDLEVDRSILDMGQILYKGPVIENFVQNELLSYGSDVTYSWNSNLSQVEFLLQNGEHVIPLEVKAGKNTRARSLEVYKQKYQPQKTIKLIGAPGGQDSEAIVLPLYYVRYLKQELGTL